MGSISSHKTISYGHQSIDEADVQAVVGALTSDWLTQGPFVEAFEKKLAKRLGAAHCTATANGTASLHLIALAMGWKQGDIVITSPNTFVASANCILYVGATPDFVDIELGSYSLDPQKLEDRVKEHRRRGDNIKAVIAVDYAGHPGDWKAYADIAGRYDLQLVNDHCHAIGAVYNNDVHFAAKYADAVNLSFHPVKHITTGEGGGIVTRHEWLDKKVKVLRNHGIVRGSNLTERDDGPWYYEMIDLGFNYRISDIQCALGVRQLDRLDRFLERRREIAKYYDQAFGNDSRLVIPKVVGGVTHAYHLYPLRITFDALSTTRRLFFEGMKRVGILCQVHYIPVHLQPYYRRHFGFAPGDFPNAEKFYAEEVSIPCYPDLSGSDLEHVVKSTFTNLK